MDVAKEWMLVIIFAALHVEATAAKASNPEMGFMKHSKRIVEIELARAEFDQIDREA